MICLIVLHRRRTETNEYKIECSEHAGMGEMKNVAKMEIQIVFISLFGNVGFLDQFKIPRVLKLTSWQINW